MKLTAEERRMADGDHGEAVALAMSVMATLGERYDAPDMVPIKGAHVDGCIYRGDEEASLVFAEKLAAAGARVRVPTTLSAGARDTERWRELRLPEAFAAGCGRMEQAYLSMGTVPAWTCAPYLHAAALRVGDQVAWAESNAIVYANTVIGARTARYGDFSDICAALIGRVPRFDLHVAENRVGQILVRCPEPALGGFDIADPATWSAVGYALGTLVPDGIPVLEGLPRNATGDQLKALCAAVATSGNVALIHVVGVTPEAATREQAFGGRQPARVVELHARDLSFAGEFDAVTGIVIGRRSALCGECLTGKILAYPHGRGSSSTSSILAEALRRGTAPAAIINVTVEHILVVAALVAGELFGTSLPIIAVSADMLARIRSGDLIEIDTERRIFRHGPARSAP